MTSTLTGATLFLLQLNLWALAVWLLDLEESRADLAELEADLEPMLAELPEPDTYDYDYDLGDRDARAAGRPADPDAAVVSRILEGGPQE